jgi:hypothetical protein
VAAVAEWAHKTLGKKSFIYPVAVQNTASRRIAEGLHGEIIENRTNPKYESVVYKIPWKGDVLSHQSKPDCLSLRMHLTA